MRRIGRGPAALIGVVATGLTLAVAELLAALGGWLALVHTAASPFSSLGQAFITITPEWLKDIGIALFGQSDKAALAVVMVVTFAVIGGVIGLLARTSLLAGTALAAVAVVVTEIAVETQPNAGIADLFPVLLAGAAGIWFLYRALPASPATPATTDSATPESATPDATPATPASAAAPATAESSTPAPAPVARRRVLQLSGAGALIAVVAGGLSRLIPGTVDVQADRNSVTLPPADPTGDSADTTAGAGTPRSAADAPGPATSDGTAPSATSGLPGQHIDDDLPPLPQSINPDVKGITPYVTANDDFYRVDTAFRLPRVTTDSWRLRVHGLVDDPFEIGWQELLTMPQVQRWITLTCVSNPVGGDLAGNAAWQGVRIADLLARAHPQDRADCVLSTSADHFTVTTPLEALTDGRDSLLAIGMNGQPLPIKHGFPVRMVVPGLYGYVSATKWVVDLEVTRFDEVTAYWTDRGWDAYGPIKTASRIDTPRHGVTVPAGTVPVAGVAWAQHRGISAVEVQVDDGPWRPADLAGRASQDTWRQWVYRWDTTAVTPGHHTLRCRATDGAGDTQTDVRRPPAPNGASGYMEVPVVVS